MLFLFMLHFDKAQPNNSESRINVDGIMNFPELF